MAEAKPDTVAVVDDDDAVRDAMRLFLEVVGHKVATFSSAADFLNADHGLMTCVLLDHHMPHMTGLELVERLRASGVGIPIMLVTGSPSSSIVARSRNPGLSISQHWNERSAALISGRTIICIYPGVETPG